MIEKYTCYPVRPLFSDILDGEPAPGVRGLYARLHLVVCPHCRRTFHEMQENKKALAELRDRDVEEP